MRAVASTSSLKRKEGVKSVLIRTAIFDACGTNSRSRPSRFVAVSLEKILTPVTFSPGLFRLATKPSRTGSSPLKKTIGIVLVKPLTAATEGPFAKTAVTRRLTKSAASAGNRFVLILRPTIFNHNIAALYIADLFKALPECARHGRIAISGCAVQKADHWHRGLLRACRKRPSRCAADERDELAPFHRQCFPCFRLKG